MDGTDRQNLADTAIAGASYEQRAHVPQKTASLATTPLSDRAAEAAPAAPSLWASVWPAVLAGAAVSAVVVGVALYFFA